MSRYSCGENSLLYLQANLKHVMEYVRGGQVDKINKLTNKGLDSNFHDQDSGGRLSALL